ncbi:hypothetical protein PybrP1_004153 [[Pythium] brassicae (nom. inval.)]|nr:hypothetical protein PybrP1_004153 [[Pythium] brassicae (nom. inval.)]
MTTLRGTTYSLWAAPEPQAERGIAEMIHASAQRLQTPSFLPHMTLLGGISGVNEADAVEKTKQLAEAMHVLAPEIRKVASKDLYFQCVFLLLQLSDELADAYRAAKQDNVEFMPHISLVYGELNEATKEEVVAALNPHFDSSAPVKLDRLQLWNTTGAVGAWTLVAEFGLAEV